MISSASPRSFGLATLTIAVVLIGLTLRGPITGIPPVLVDIASDLSLSPLTAGLVTALPLTAFALLSPVVPGLVRWVGVDKLILLSLLGLGFSMAARPWFGSIGFLLSTLLVGIAITVGNVLIPVVVRRDAGDRVPQVMAVSVSAYGLGQGLTAFFAVPIAAEMGWRWSLTFPVILVCFGIVAWLIHQSWMRGRHTRTSAPSVKFPVSAATRGSVWSNASAWWLALFFGMQSLLFYTASTWTPEQLMATGGIDQTTAGNALTIFHLLGIGGTLLVPYLVKNLGSAQRLGIAIAAGWLAYFLGIFVLPQAWLLWAIIGGWVQGAGIGLGMTLIAARPVDVQLGRRVSGMVQCVGYSLAALGPLAIGGLVGLTDGWLAPTVALSACAVIMGISALQAGSDEPIT